MARHWAGRPVSWLQMELGIEVPFCGYVRCVSLLLGTGREGCSHCYLVLPSQKKYILHRKHWVGGGGGRGRALLSALELYS